jgi:branched-chain amino acid transport system permease protein
VGAGGEDPDVIGGIGSFEGPIIGTIVYFVLTFSIAIILVERRSLWGLCRRFFPDDLVPIAHKMPRR